ncbi:MULTISPECIES: transposase [Pseudooceanicola]
MTSRTKFHDDFKRDAVSQIMERRSPIREVAGRLDKSHQALCA